MKHLISAALALALVGGTSALAQPPESGNHERGQEGGAHPGGQGAPHANAAAPAQAPRPSAGAPQGGAREGGYTGGPRGGAMGGPTGASQNYQHAPSGGAPNNGYHSESHGGYPNAGPRNAAPPTAGAKGPQGSAVRIAPQNYHPRYGAPGVQPGGARPRYDPQYFPRSFQPSRRFTWRGAVWRPQPGYYYRHWAYGDRLPYGWFDQRWYIDDYYYYDLPVPPYGYEWVRVGPDALLIELDDGQVAEAVYGLFY